MRTKKINKMVVLDSTKILILKQFTTVQFKGDDNVSCA